MHSIFLTLTGPHSIVVNMSDCRSRGGKFDPGLVPYFRDHEIISISSLPVRVVVSYKWKYVHQVLLNHLVKLAQEKSVARIKVNWPSQHDHSC